MCLNSNVTVQFRRLDVPARICYFCSTLKNQPQCLRHMILRSCGTAMKSNFTIAVTIFIITTLSSFAQNKVDLGLSVDWADSNWGTSDSLAIGTMYKYEDVPLGNSDDWRLPTKEEFDELSTMCSIGKEPIRYNNMYFARVIGVNGNSIILPLCGSTKEINKLHRKIYKGEKNFATDYMVQSDNSLSQGLAYYSIGLGCYINMSYGSMDLPMYIRAVYKYTSKSPNYSIIKDDGTKYDIVIKQEKIGKYMYSEYVDAFAVIDGCKKEVSVYDGGDDLDDCGMEVRYKTSSNLKKGQTVIQYDEKERMLYIPRASFEGELSKDEYDVFKFDGNTFVRVDIE